MEMGQTNGSMSLCSSLDGLVFVPSLPPAPGLLLCQLRAVGTGGFTKTPNNQRDWNYFSLSIHKLILQDKSQKTKVKLFALSPRPCSAMQGFKFAITAQQNYEISLPNQFTCSSWQVKQPIFH